MNPQEQKCSAADTELAAILEAVIYASRGEPVSDVMESFPVVRAVVDLWAQLAECRGARDQLQQQVDDAKALLDAFPVYGQRWRDFSLVEHVRKTLEERERIGELCLDFAEQILPEDRLGIELANERADKAEADLAAWRSRGQALVAQLQALPRYDTEIVGDHNSANVDSYRDEDGEFVKWRDLADALAALLNDEEKGA